MTIDEQVYSEMNPGIRGVVRWLREDLGFNTTDSGDGATHQFACDRDHAYVVMTADPARLAAEADRLASALLERGVVVQPQSMEPGAQVSIQASYDPTNRIGVIDLTGLTDAKLNEARP